jgi:hypothetical protein
MEIRLKTKFIQLLGAATLSITTFGIMTLSIKGLYVTLRKQCSTNILTHFLFVMLNLIILNVVMLNVMAPFIGIFYSNFGGKILKIRHSFLFILPPKFERKIPDVNFIKLFYLRR